VEQLFLSLIQLIIAVVLSAIGAYLAFYLFQWFTRGVNEWEALRQGNAAVGVVLGAMLIAVAIVLRPALMVNTATWDVGGPLFSRVLLAEAVQLAVGLVLAVVTLAAALYLFAALTRGINESEELKKGNLAIAGLLAGVVIGVGLMVSQAVGEIMRLVASVLF
jgi:putative membrane protein